MTYPLTAGMGDAGVNGVGVIVNYQMGWIFRALLTGDVGIDAQVETLLAGQATGRHFGLQIKSGPSWFSEPAPDGTGWVLREDTQTHRDYWLRYQLPVLIVLYNPEAHAAYWQQVTEQTAIVTGKGFKVIIPASQRLDATAKPVLAALARTGPTDSFSNLLDQLPAECAARLRDLDEHDPAGARRLAARMVAGRAGPAAAAQEIMDAAPEGWPWVAWVAVGEFAGQYGQAKMAAECFVRAAQSQPDPDGGRWLAFAGIMLTAEDPHEARELLERASSLPGGDLLAATGLAFIDHGSQPGPVPIPEILSNGGDRAASEATIQRFLADQAARAGDRATAILHHEGALRLMPDSIGQQLALAEALLQGEAMPVTATRMADYRRAANLADAARAATRRSLLDSRHPAELLMQARTLAGDDEAAARVATAAPAGEATPQEAAAPALAFPSARTAYERGDLVRAEKFAVVVQASGDPKWTTQLDAIVAEHEGADRDELERRWRAVVAAPVKPGQRLWALSQLARLGSWPLSELDTMSADGLLAPGMYDMLHARALAVQGNHQRALALLRQHAAKTSLVAEEYARLLNTLGRVDECLTACDQGSQLFGETRLDLYAMDVLTRAGRVDDALARGKEFLTRADLPLHLRHHVRAKIFDTYYARHDWPSCERLMVTGINEIARLQEDLRAGWVDPLTLPASAGEDLAEYRRGYAWRLIVAQFNQGSVDRALATLDAYQPEITSAGEVATWVDLQRLRGWTPHTAIQALDLAARPDLPSQLIGRILNSLAQSIPIPHDAPDGPPKTDVVDPWAGLPAEFHDQLRDQWARFAQAQQPPPVGAPVTDADQSFAALRDLIQPEISRQANTTAAVWYGRAPLGVLSTAVGQPYVLTLAEQRARLLPAVASDLQTHQWECDCAAAALGTRITVEPSALFVCAAILDRWGAVSAEFSEILIAEPSTRDIFNSHIGARATANLAGYLGIDHSSGNLHTSETTDAQLAEVIRRTTAVHIASQTCRVVDVDDLDAIGSRDPITDVGAYMAPLAVAVEHDVPLYSDDVVLRAAARSRGIRCFGTLALFEVLATQQENPADPDDLQRTLLRHHVVDLHEAGSLILGDLAQRRRVDSAVLIALARPATWQPFNERPVDFTAAVLSQAYQCDPQALRDVVAAAAAGAAAAFNDPETVLAMIATVALTYVLDLTPDNAALVWPAIRSIGEQYGVNPTAKTRELLRGVLTDPQDRFALNTSDAQHMIDAALANL